MVLKVSASRLRQISNIWEIFSVNLDRAVGAIGLPTSYYLKLYRTETYGRKGEAYT